MIVAGFALMLFGTLVALGAACQALFQEGPVAALFCWLWCAFWCFVSGLGLRLLVTALRLAGG